jgi:hypothetical protein
MKQSRIVLIALLALGALAGCDSDPPTAPTPPTPQAPVPPATLTGLTVFAPESLVVAGSTLALRAHGRYSDGSSQPVQPQWLVSPAAVAEVTAAGVLNARAPGEARVTARLAEFEAQTTVRVTPNYAGTWRGSWQRLECFGPRCGEGDLSNPTVDLLISQAANGRELSAVLLFGPWNASRYAMSGRALSIGAEASLFVFWVERGPAGERLLEISTNSGSIVMSERQTINGRLSMRFTEGGQVTRLELTLDELALVSRAVRVPTITPRLGTTQVELK